MEEVSSARVVIARKPHPLALGQRKTRFYILKANVTRQQFEQYLPLELHIVRRILPRRLKKTSSVSKSVLIETLRVVSFKREESGLKQLVGPFRERPEPYQLLKMNLHLQSIVTDFFFKLDRKRLSFCLAYY